MISVIIPVYNAAPYLGRCLDSILCSTCPDFEVIAVDDGSTDGSRQLALEYTKRDRRVKTFFQEENRGVSAARNRGLEECGGQWIVFVDADDVISPDFLSLIAAEDCSAQDLLLFDFARTEEELSGGVRNGGRLRYGREEMPRLFLHALDCGQLTENGNINLASSNARAFKRSIIERHALRFSTDLSYGEDMAFNMEYQLRANSCLYIPAPVYFYQIHGDSSSRRFDSVRSVRMRWERAEKIRAILAGGNMLRLVEDAYYSSVLRMMAFVLLRLIFAPPSSLTSDEKGRLCREMRENAVLKEAMAHNRGGPPDRRLVIFFFRLGCYPAVSLMGRYSYMRMKRKNPREIAEMRESGWYR